MRTPRFFFVFPKGDKKVLIRDPGLTRLDYKRRDPQEAKA